MNAEREGSSASVTASAAKTSQTCIVVLGVHRSGTSAFTRVLSLLGAALPVHIMEGGATNEKGHWEPEHLVKLHDQLLVEAGTRWDDIGRLPALPSDRLAYYKTEIVRIVKEEYGEAPVLVLKDPRMCRLMPIWYEVLDETGMETRFVIPFRNPLEVAKSLRQRNGLSLAHGCLLWLRDLLESEYQTRDERRVFAHYQQLLVDPVATARNVMAKLIGSAPAIDEKREQEIRSFIELTQRHQMAKLEELRYPLVAYQWLREAYEAYARLAFCPTDEGAQRRLDGIRNAFDASVVPFGMLMADARHNQDAV